MDLEYTNKKELMIILRCADVKKPQADALKTKCYSCLKVCWIAPNSMKEAQKKGCRAICNSCFSQQMQSKLVNDFGKRGMLVRALPQETRTNTTKTEKNLGTHSRDLENHRGDEDDDGKARMLDTMKKTYPQISKKNLDKIVDISQDHFTRFVTGTGTHGDTIMEILANTTLSLEEKLVAAHLIGATTGLQHKLTLQKGDS